MGTFTIKRIKGWEVLDSRGNPMVEVEAHTECGFGRPALTKHPRTMFISIRGFFI
jgi:enolase